MQAHRDRDPPGRERLDDLLYGPPSDEDWANDPASMTAALPADAMSGEAP